MYRWRRKLFVILFSVSLFCVYLIQPTPKVSQDKHFGTHNKEVQATQKKQQYVSEDCRLRDGRPGAGASYPSSPVLDVPENFSVAVRSRVDANNMIIIPAVVDDGYLENARNLYLSSIRRLGLTNKTLFVCISKSACAEARDLYDLPAVMYREATQTQSGLFDSRTFIQKASMKHYIIYDIIKMGYDVLLTDLDIHWLKNPVDELRESCIKNGRDFVIQSEAGNSLNIGFMYVRPTNASLALYKEICRQAEGKHQLGAQKLFNNIVNSHGWKTRLKYGVLSLREFPDGHTYFETGKRQITPVQQCKSCFICHNNWIVGTPAKTYRFREHLMWYLDDRAYYSDPCRKYLVYENSEGRTKSCAKDELIALQSALAIATLSNRTLILPRTFCYKKTSTQLNGILMIKPFDDEFKDKYRESTFLRHHLVPNNVKKSVCGKFIILNSYNKAAKSAGPTASSQKGIHRIFYPKDDRSGASQEEIEEWMNSKEIAECSVITFHNLYFAFKGFSDEMEADDFAQKISRGFIPGSYRQLGLLRNKTKAV